MGCICLVVYLKGGGFAWSLQSHLWIACDMHHGLLKAYSIIKLFSFFSTFVRGIYGLTGDLIFNFSPNNCHDVFLNKKQTVELYPTHSIFFSFKNTN